MIELMLYERFGGELSSFAVLNICVDSCLDPEDQDHAGNNFNLQIRNLEFTLFDAWNDDMYLEGYRQKLFALTNQDIEVTLELPGDTDSLIVARSSKESIDFTVTLNEFVTGSTSLVIESLACPREEFLRFLEYYDDLIEARNQLYQRLGITLG